MKSGLLRSLREFWRRLESEQEVRGTGVGAVRVASTEVPTNAVAAGCREDSVLILSHTDPQVSVSGVDRFVRAEIEALEAAGFCVWVLSPRAGLTPRTYTWRRGAELIADGCPPDFVRDEVLALLATGHVHATAIHHLLGFEPELLEGLGLFSGTGKTLVYLHDEHLVQLDQLAGEFSFLARNFGWDAETFADLLPRLQAAVDRLVCRADEVVLPSIALRNHLASAMERAGVAPQKVRVVPEVTFTPYRDKEPVAHQRTRLAYLGHALPNKGWPAWQALLADSALSERFDFFHIGDADPAAASSAQAVPYSTCDGNPYAPVALLHDHEIDLVLLWSTVMESASYTMAEAHAAGVPVLTSHASGNIAASIHRGDVLGRVFESEASLREFLLDPVAVETLVAAGAAEPLRYMHHESFLCRLLEA